MKHTRECIALQMQPFCNITQPPLQTNDEILFNGSSYYHKKPSTSKSEQKLCIIYSSVVKELNNLGFNEITKGECGTKFSDMRTWGQWGFLVIALVGSLPIIIFCRQPLHARLGLLRALGSFKVAYLICRMFKRFSCARGYFADRSVAINQTHVNSY